MKLPLLILASTLVLLVCSENDTNTDEQIYESGDAEMSSGGESILSGSGIESDLQITFEIDIVLILETYTEQREPVLSEFEFVDINVLEEDYESTTFCGDNYVFDEVLEECRKNEILANSSANCNSTIALNDSEFEYAGDNMVLFRGELEEIQFNTSQGQPVICVNFTQNGTVNATRIIHIYPIGYDYITYVGCGLSIIGCCLVILTFCLFKDLRTLPTKILVNVCSTILASNSLIILTSSPASDLHKFCEAIAIFNHFFSLAQFMWMTVMCAEVMYSFYLASRLIQVDPKQNRKRFFIYCLISWLIPLLIVSICITLNYATADIINYGRKNGIGSSSCWINDFNSAIVVFLVPIATATLLQSIIFIINSQKNSLLLWPRILQTDLEFAAHCRINFALEKEMLTANSAVMFVQCSHGFSNSISEIVHEERILTTLTLVGVPAGKM